MLDDLVVSPGDLVAMVYIDGTEDPIIITGLTERGRAVGRFVRSGSPIVLTKGNVVRMLIKRYHILAGIPIDEMDAQLHQRKINSQNPCGEILLNTTS